jgi:hypothetical protein
MNGIKHFKILWLPCSYGWHTLYSGLGYIQGMGFDLAYKALTIGKFKVITDISFIQKTEWIRDLKTRWKKDDEQQLT